MCNTSGCCHDCATCQEAIEIDRRKGYEAAHAKVARQGGDETEGASLVSAYGGGRDTDDLRRLVVSN